MAKKGISETHFKDGRVIFTAKKFKGIKSNGWPCIKFKKLRYDTGYSYMVRLSDKQDIWLNRNRCVLMIKEKKVYLQPDYYEQNFSDIPTIQTKVKKIKKNKGHGSK